MWRLLYALFLFVFSSSSWSAAQTIDELVRVTVPRGPGAIGGTVVEVAVRRGFSPVDPRVAQTVSAVNRYAASTGLMSTTKLIGKFVAPLGLLFTLQEMAESIRVNQDGTVTQNKDVLPGQSGGLTQGGMYWKCGTFSAVDPYTVCLQHVTPASGDWAIFEFYASSSTTNRVGFTYSLIHPEYCKAGGCQKSTVYADYFPSGAPATCPAGSYHKSGTGCVQFTFKPFKQQKQFVDLDGYVRELDESKKALKANTEMMRRLADQLWRAASSAPDYDGIPYDERNPVTDQDVESDKARRLADWPTWGDLPIVNPKPVDNPYLNPDATTPTPPSQSASAVVVKVDLGVDPGIGAPTLENTPTDIFKPVKALMSGWMNWEVPTHSGQCPTWYGSPSVGGYTFQLDLSYHCQFAESYRSAILAAALAAWAVVAVFIILSA